MRRANVDKLKVGDIIKYLAYSLWDEELVVVNAKVNEIREDGSARIEYHLDGGIYRDYLNNELVVN